MLSVKIFSLFQTNIYITKVFLRAGSCRVSASFFIMYHYLGTSSELVFLRLTYSNPLCESMCVCVSSLVTWLWLLSHFPVLYATTRA